MEVAFSPVSVSSAKMAARMATECPGGHRHGELTGGGLTASTSYYTDEFAERAVRAMIEVSALDYHEFMRNLAGTRASEEQALIAGKREGLHGRGPELQG
eukprot:807725-Pyramimonas_sp.AAC.1